MKVYVPGNPTVYTVDYATMRAFGGTPGVLYYGFAERPGELYDAVRCSIRSLDPGETVSDWVSAAKADLGKPHSNPAPEWIHAVAVAEGQRPKKLPPNCWFVLFAIAYGTDLDRKEVVRNRDMSVADLEKWGYIKQSVTQVWVTTEKAKALLDAALALQEPIETTTWSVPKHD